MNCRICGAEIEADEQECSKCIEMGNKVQVLTLEEKQHFNGITVEQDEGEEQGEDQYGDSRAHQGNQQMYSKQFSISSTSLLTKLFLGIILAGVIFVALPVAIVIISIVGIMTYLVRK